jgi:hypothetical protein
LKFSGCRGNARADWQASSAKINAGTASGIWLYAKADLRFAEACRAETKIRRGRKTDAKEKLHRI